MGDVTSDGYADIVVTGGADGTRVFAAIASPGTAPNTFTWGGISTTHVAVAGDSDSTDIVVVDLNNDSRLDLFVTRSAGGDQFHLNTGPTNPWAFTTTTTFTSPANGVAVAVGDLNGDGYADAVIARSGAPPGVHYNKGVPTGATSWQGLTEPAALVTGDTSLTATDIQLGDLDGDGDLDVVVTTAAGTWLYRNNGCDSTGRNCFDSRTALTGPVGAGAILANVDTDTDLDLVRYGAVGGGRLFQQHPVATTIIGLADVGVLGIDGVNVTDGQGAFIIYTGIGLQGGVAGTFSGSIDLGSGAVGASVAVQFNATNRIIDEVVVVGGVTIPVKFNSGQRPPAQGRT